MEELDLALHFTVCFFILINGEAYGFYPSSRGPGQGDPLLPLLFILVMESKLVITTLKGLLDGFLISNPCSEGLLIFHLLFADDTLIFCKPNESNLGYLRCILLLKSYVWS